MRFSVSTELFASRTMTMSGTVRSMDENSTSIGAKKSSPSPGCSRIVSSCFTSLRAMR